MKKESRIPEGWKLAPKELQEPQDHFTTVKTTYVQEGNERFRLVHCQPAFADGYWKAVDTRSGQDARGETAEDALAALAGWTLEKKEEYKTEGGKDYAREYTRGITLRVIDFVAAERVERCWIARDFTKTQASGWSARVALLALAEMHRTKAEEAEKEAGNVNF